MRKIILLFGFMLFLVGIVPVNAARQNVYTVIASSVGVADKNWDIDLNSYEIDGASFQLSFSSSTSLAGTPVMKIQGSTDGDNYEDLFVGTDQCSVSYATPYTPDSALWDLGEIFFSHLRFSFTAGSAGSVTYSLTMNGRKK